MLAIALYFPAKVSIVADKMRTIFCPNLARLRLPWQGGYTKGSTPISHPPIERVPPMKRLPILLKEEET
jgi:hypothetical protein